MPKMPCRIKFTYIFLLFFIFELTVQEEKVLERDKRHLVWPVRALYKFIMSIGIPVKLGKRQSMACGWNLQLQYGLPLNSSHILKSYPPIISKSREKREEEYGDMLKNERYLFYRGLESALNSHGVDGKACVLRSICDNAMNPLHHNANGLYGELLHIAFTPTYGGTGNSMDPIYIDAQKAGEFGVDCVSVYPNCPLGYGIMDVMSILDH